LQALWPKLDGIVSRYHPFILETEDLLRLEGDGPGTIGQLLLLGGNSKALIEARQIVLKEGIGLFLVTSPCQTQFYNEPILQGAKEPFNTSRGLVANELLSR
jgi:hypothetical protein